MGWQRLGGLGLGVTHTISGLQPFGSPTSRRGGSSSPTAPSNAGDSEPPASPPPSPPASPIPACWTPAPASPRPDGGEAGDSSAGGEESLLADPALAEVLRQLQAQLEYCDARCRSASVDGGQPPGHADRGDRVRWPNTKVGCFLTLAERVGR